MGAPKPPARPLAVYIHWPFCQAKCPYCDFNSHVRREVDQSAWQDALIADINAQAARLGPREITSIFFGGGTPSLMEPRVVAAVLERLAQVWTLASDAEITLEANPTSVEAARFAGYRAAGVNRASVGVQALNNADLKALGRLHSVDEALAAFDLAQTTFDKTSFDLIYARQNQALAAWEAELQRALTICGDHLSLYQLTIEPNTRFGDLYAKGALRGLPSGDLGADMYLLTRDMCRAAGFDDYEVSNYARAGATCRHNLSYWTYGEYVGIGPGAHGRVDVAGSRRATVHKSMPSAYLEATDFAVDEALSKADQAGEYLLMGLRLRSGVEIKRLQGLMDAAYPETEIAALCKDGLLDLTNGQLAATDSGRLVLNALIERLLP